MMAQGPLEAASVQLSALPPCSQHLPGAQAGKEGGTGSRGRQPQSTRQPAFVCRLAVISILTRAPDEALVASLPPRALGLGEGLLEGMLLGVDLIIEELSRQLCPIANLNLRRVKRWSPQW